MGKITWSETFFAEFNEILEYLAAQDLDLPPRLISELTSLSNKLKRFPRMGQIYPKYSDPNFREILLQNYRIFYSVDEDQITFVSIVHVKRNYRP